MQPLVHSTQIRGLNTQMHASKCQCFLHIDAPSRHGPLDGSDQRRIDKPGRQQITPDAHIPRACAGAAKEAANAELASWIRGRLWAVHVRSDGRDEDERLCWLRMRSPVHSSIMRCDL